MASSKRCILTAPQFRVLKELDEAEAGERTYGGSRVPAVAERLVALDCAEPLTGDVGCSFRITDHGRNILDLHRSFFEPANPGGQD